MSLLTVGNDIRWVENGICCNWMKVVLIVNRGESISDGNMIMVLDGWRVIIVVDG